MGLISRLDDWRHSTSKAIKRRRRQSLADALGEYFGRDVTILANNCFGGRLYQDLGWEYRTPTAGLFFMMEDFIELCRNTRHYFTEATLTFTPHSRYEDMERVHQAEGSYPIGLLDGRIEIHFLHYRTEELARATWERRCRRVNYDNIVVFGLEIHRVRPEDFPAFETIPYERKYFFTTAAHPGCPSEIVMPANRRGNVGDGMRYTRRFYKALVRRLGNYPL